MAKGCPITGTFRITHMDEWNRDFVDAEIEGYISFGRNRNEFHFGYVHGWITPEATKRDGRPAIEFSWEGMDSSDFVSGRGWVVLEGVGSLEGKLFLHRGESSCFTAKANHTFGSKVKLLPELRARSADIEGEVLRRRPVRHAALPAPLRMRVQAVYKSLSGLLESTLDQFEAGIRRDDRPEVSIALWERIAARTRRVQRTMPTVDRRALVRMLRAHTIGLLTPTEQSNRQVQRMICTARGR